MNQTYCKLRNEFKNFNGNSAKSLNLAWTTLTLFFPIYFSVVNKKQSVQFLFSLYLTLLLLFLVWIICPRLYCVEKKMESHFELRFEKHILPYLRALTQAERTAAFVIIPHLFILWVASRRWVRLVLYCSSGRRTGHGGSFRSKKQESERWRASLKRPSGQQCMGLTCHRSLGVENAVERKLWSQRGQTVREEAKRVFWQVQVFQWSLED